MQPRFARFTIADQMHRTDISSSTPITAVQPDLVRAAPKLSREYLLAKGSVVLLIGFGALVFWLFA